jgi:hypothetical protein
MITTHTSQETFESIYRHFVRSARIHHRMKLSHKEFTLFWFVEDQSRVNFLHAARELGSAMGKVRTFPARCRKEAA